MGKCHTKFVGKAFDLCFRLEQLSHLLVFMVNLLRDIMFNRLYKCVNAYVCFLILLNSFLFFAYEPATTKNHQ